MNLFGRRRAGSRSVRLPPVSVAVVALLGGVFRRGWVGVACGGRSHCWGRYNNGLHGHARSRDLDLHVDRRLRRSDFAPDGSERLHGGRRRARDHRHRPRRRQFQRWRGDECPRRTLDACEQRHHPSRGVRVPWCKNCESAPGSGVQLVQVGLFFDDAGGTATDVTVRDITQHSGCQTGNGIRANARAGTARTVTLTHVTVTGFQKNGVTGSGQMTLNVGGNSTIGPPDQHLPGGIATNSVQYGVGGAGGTFTGNTVIGSGFGAAGTASDGNPAVQCRQPDDRQQHDHRCGHRHRDLGHLQHQRHDLQQRGRPHRARTHRTTLEPGSKLTEERLPR